MNDEPLNVTIPPEHAGQRLDKCLSLHLPGFSRSRIQQFISLGCVKAGDVSITDASRKVKEGEAFAVTPLPPENSTIEARPLALAVVFEDEHMLVIDKPAGMTVHPAPGHYDDTLVNALLAHCGDSLSGIGGVMRPGIVHRIDKDTSGLLVVAKHDIAHRHLSAQLAERTLKRHYAAVVKGVPVPPAGTVTGNIGRSPRNRKKMAVLPSGGKPAVTHYRIETMLLGAALLHCSLETGRTHQIRVHMTHIGHPLLGDPLYGRPAKTVPFPRQALHAMRLALLHPITGTLMEFNSPLPEDMRQLIESLKPDNL